MHYPAIDEDMIVKMLKACFCQRKTIVVFLVFWKIMRVEVIKPHLH